MVKYKIFFFLDKYNLYVVVVLKFKLWIFIKKKYSMLLLNILYIIITYVVIATIHESKKV